MVGPAPVGTAIILSERAPATMDVRVPCAAVAAPSLRDELPKVVLSTGRRPVDFAGLLVQAEADDLVIYVGATELSRVTVPRSLPKPCDVLVKFASSSWQVVYNGELAAQGSGFPPPISGLYTDIPPAVGGAGSPTVVLTAENQTASPSARQLVLTAAALAVAGLTMWPLVGARVLNRMRRRRNHRLTSRRWKLVDATVALTTLAWTIVGSPLTDDGWVMMNVRSMRMSGAYANYYDGLNASAVFGFLHYTVLHTVGAVSDTYLAYRLVAAAIWFTVWWLMRPLIEAQARRVGERFAGLTIWTAATVFVVWLIGPGLSLRQESTTALALIIAVRGMQRFRRAPSLAVLAVPVFASGLGISIHPVAIVALAPVLAGWRPIWRWLRSDRSGTLLGLGGVVLCASAVLLLLVFADSDTALWAKSADIMSMTNVHSGGILGEWNRYRMIFQPGWGPPLMRTTFVLPAVASVLWACRTIGRRRATATSMRNNEYALIWVLGLLLLSLSPSKWTVHMAGLAPVAVLAVSGEVAAIGTWSLSPVRWRRWASVCGISMLVVAALFGAYLWNPGQSAWVDFALSADQSEQLLSYAIGGLVVTLMTVTAGFAAWSRWRGRHEGVGRLFLARLPILVAVGAIVATFGLYSYDNIDAGGNWTLARQQLGIDHGRCGLASDVEVPDVRSARMLEVAQNNSIPAGFEVTSTPGGISAVWESDRSESKRSSIEQLSTSWVRLDIAEMIAFWTVGPVWADTDLRLNVEYGRVVGKEVTSLGSRPIVRFARNDDARSMAWRPLFVDVSARREGDRADVVRVVATMPDGGRGWAGLSEPAGVDYITLERLLEENPPAAIFPSVVPFIPCADHSRIERGVVTPQQVTLDPASDPGTSLITFGRSSRFMMFDAYEMPADVLPARRIGDPNGWVRGFVVSVVDLQNFQTFEAKLPK